MYYIETVLIAATPSPSVTPSSSLSPSPSPTQHITVDLLDHVSTASTAPDPWQFTLGMLVTLLAAGLAAAGVWLAVRQRMWADRQTQLWNRMEWALGLVTGSTDGGGQDDRRSVGLFVLTSIVTEADAARKKPLFQRWQAIRHGAPVGLTDYDRTLLTKVGQTYVTRDTEEAEDEAQ